MSESKRPAFLPPPTAPLDVARVFAVEHCMEGGSLTLRYWRGGWWQWKSTHWQERGLDDIRSRLYEFTDGASYLKNDKNGVAAPMPWLPNARRVSDLIDALKGVCMTEAAISPPCWLDGRPSGTTVACRNGLLDVMSRKMLLHTPFFFNLTSLPFEYQEDAVCPTWDNFMHDLWGDDEEPPQALEQVFGCAVAGKLDLHRIPVLVGPPRAGKSLIASVFASLVGDANATWPRLVGLTDDKTLSSLIGKSACIIADMRATARRAPEIAEVLLMISGGDPFTIDRKYKEAWIGSLSAMIMMISNELPTIRDAGGALPNRYLPLILTESWKGRENRALKERLMAELPGIFNRALEGLEDVTRMGRFTFPKASEEAAGELEEMASPMKRFVDERLVVMPAGGDPDDYSVSTHAVLHEYNSWADANNEARISKELIGKRLRAVLPRIRWSQPRDENGRRLTAYVGVRLARQETAAAKALAEMLRRTDGKARVVGRRAGGVDPEE